MKDKKNLLIIILCVLIIGLIIFLVIKFIPSKKEELALPFLVENVQNFNEFKVNDIVDIYISDSEITDKELENPFIKNIKITKITNQKLEEVDDNTAYYYYLVIPDTNLRATNILELVRFNSSMKITFKKSDSKKEKVEFNDKIEEIISEKYEIKN